MDSRLSRIERFIISLGVSIRRENFRYENIRREYFMRENFRREIRREKVRQNGPFYTTNFEVVS